MPSKHEIAFRQLWKNIGPSGVGELIAEHRFDPPSRSKFDFALLDYRIAIELEGGTWSRGRHTRGKGFAADCEKYNRAAVLGWIVLRYPGEALTKRPAQVIEDIEDAILMRNREAEQVSIASQDACECGFRGVVCGECGEERY